MNIPVSPSPSPSRIVIKFCFLTRSTVFVYADENTAIRKYGLFCVFTSDVFDAPPCLLVFFE